MAHYLAVETEIGIYEALKLKKDPFFKQNNDQQSQYECTLSEIEEYTTRFTNYKQLSQYLTSYQILKYHDLNKPLAIFYVNGIEAKKLEGDILYKESKTFIDNPKEIIDYINTKINEQDTIFLRKLQSILPETSIITYITAILAAALEENTQIPNQKLTSKLAESLIYDCYLDASGDLIITETLDNTKIHKMVSFITRYENYLNTQKSNYTRKKEKP